MEQEKKQSCNSTDHVSQVGFNPVDAENVAFSDVSRPHLVKILV